MQTYQLGARFEELIESVLMTPLDSRYTQVGFNLISVQVCITQKGGSALFERVQMMKIDVPSLNWSFNGNLLIDLPYQF